MNTSGGEDKRFEDSLLAAMEEMLASERGELQLRSRTLEHPTPELQVAAPPAYDGPRVRAVRDRLALSQPAFAAALNVSPQTVRAWERGARQPDGPTLRLLEIAEAHPETLLATIMGRAGQPVEQIEPTRRAG